VYLRRISAICAVVIALVACSSLSTKSAYDNSTIVQTESGFVRGTIRKAELYFSELFEHLEN